MKKEKEDKGSVTTKINIEPVVDAKKETKAVVEKKPIEQALTEPQRKGQLLSVKVASLQGSYPKGENSHRGKKVSYFTRR